MKYIVKTTKSVDQACADLEQAVVDNQFGHLCTHDLKATMESKGVDFPHECRILEVCNPHKAKAVLMEDMHINMALPCRISVWEQDGGTLIGTLEPTALLGMFGDTPTLNQVAEDVEQTIKTIIDQAK